MKEESQIAVSCRGLTKTYGVGSATVVALRGVDLDVKKGELLMLVGPSGCGKTTLISIIAAILNQDEGECLVFGNDLKTMPDLEKTRYRGTHIGFVFQAFNLIPMLTVQENVTVPLMLLGTPLPEALERAAHMLERVGLGDKLKKFPNTLSGGQQQRVAIARAFVHNPQLVVCDEPTSALDHHTGQKVVELLREIIAEKHRALVVVTHDSRIFEYADRIARMDDGRIV
jgi:putative ABC transport system ATP-binding protein